MQLDRSTRQTIRSKSNGSVHLQETTANNAAVESQREGAGRVAKKSQVQPAAQLQSVAQSAGGLCPDAEDLGGSL